MALDCYVLFCISNDRYVRWRGKVLKRNHTTKQKERRRKKQQEGDKEAGQTTRGLDEQGSGGIISSVEAETPSPSSLPERETRKTVGSVM